MFNEQCVKTTKNADTHAIDRGQGWRESVEEAISAATQAEYRLQNETEARIKRDKNMSEAAKAEIIVAMASTDEQVATMPVSPIPKKAHWKTLQKIEREKAAAEAAA